MKRTATSATSRKEGPHRLAYLCLGYVRSPEGNEGTTMTNKLRAPKVCRCAAKMFRALPWHVPSAEQTILPAGEKMPKYTMPWICRTRTSITKSSLNRSLDHLEDSQSKEFGGSLQSSLLLRLSRSISMLLNECSASTKRRSRKALAGGNSGVAYGVGDAASTAGDGIGEPASAAGVSPDIFASSNLLCHWRCKSSGPSCRGAGRCCFAGSPAVTFERSGIRARISAENCCIAASVSA